MGCTPARAKGGGIRRRWIRLWRTTPTLTWSPLSELKLECPPLGEPFKVMGHTKNTDQAEVVDPAVAGLDTPERYYPDNLLIFRLTFSIGRSATCFFIFK
jgi:hypothetical protein